MCTLYTHFLISPARGIHHQVDLDIDVHNETTFSIAADGYFHASHCGKVRIACAPQVSSNQAGGHFFSIMLVYSLYSTWSESSWHVVLHCKPQLQPTVVTPEPGYNFVLGGCIRCSRVSVVLALLEQPAKHRLAKITMALRQTNFLITRSPFLFRSSVNPSQSGGNQPILRADDAATFNWCSKICWRGTSDFDDLCIEQFAWKPAQL
jgi:hypothetical protein